MKTPVKVTVLILLHLILLNGLFILRFPLRESFKHRKEWHQGEFTGKPTDYVKLYFSSTVEAYYYEWSSLVLGKKLGKDYPIAQRSQGELGSFLSSPPQRRMPYRDIPFEYPPLLMVPLLASRWISHSFLGFMRALAFFSSLAYLGCLAAAYGIWKMLPPGIKVSWPQLLFLSLLSLLALGQLYANRLDVYPVLFYLIALLFFLKERYVLSSFGLALGVLTKFYPLLLAPLFALHLLKSKKYLETGRAVLIFLLVLFVGFGGLAFLTRGGIWDSFRFHASRGIQIESVYALVPYLGHWFGNIPITIYESHHSINIGMPHGDLLLKLSMLLPLFLFFWIYFLIWRSPQRVPREGNRSEGIVEPAILLVFAFILSFKVFSPQYLIWLTPLIFLTEMENKKAFFSIFIFLLMLTQMIWPNFYALLENARPLGVVMLFIRNAGLIMLFLWELFRWRKQVSYGRIVAP